ncbi:MAG: C69 family dipeptidase [Bacteroidales bacterium]
MKKYLLLTVLGGLAQLQSEACTNFIVTKGASKNGTSIISYAADSHTLYGELYQFSAATHEDGAMRKIIDWDTQKPLGEIPEAPQTYNVIGNINEHGVAISETTFGGRSELRDTTGIMDYGSLIYVTLQRATSARDAIAIMGELVEKYGYYSSGESFTIADADEVWILEMIGKGTTLKFNAKKKPFAKGAVWVAVRIPDGSVSGHANQARIQTFSLANGKNAITYKQIAKRNLPTVEVIYSDDVIDFARACGYFSGKDSEFSFSDTYNPIDFGGARFCDARVWSFFRTVSPEMDTAYLEYAMGHNLQKRMPLYITPNRLLTVKDIAASMRNHYEGTPLDMRLDAGAGAYACPYRWRPMTWEVDSVKYVHERATATQQTGFWFVAECRNPTPLSTLWFGVDDAATSCLVPIFACVNRVPEAFRVGNGSMSNYSSTAAFWLFNRVANFAYSRYESMSADITKIQQSFEGQAYYEAQQFIVENKNITNRELLINKATAFSFSKTQILMQIWRQLDAHLLIKYIDGNVKKEKRGKFETTRYGVLASPIQNPLPERERRAIVQSNGNVLKMK